MIFMQIMILPNMNKQQPITITTMITEDKEMAIAMEDKEVAIAMEGKEVAVVGEDVVVAEEVVLEELIPETPLVIVPILTRVLS